jgi:PAS domain S-box-containing protein
MDEELYEKDGDQQESPFDEMTAVRTPREALRRLQSILGGVLEFDVSILSFWNEDEKETFLYIVPSEAGQSPSLRRLPASSPPEFRLIDGSLVAVSKLDERHSSLQITTLFSDKERYVQSGLSVPIRTSGERPATLVLASYSESLVGRRAVFDDSELKMQLAEVLEGIDPTGAIPELHEEHRLSYEEIFHRLSTAAAVISPDGTLHQINQAFESLTGYGPADVARGLTLFEIFHPKDRPRLSRILGAVSDDGTSKAASGAVELTLVGRDGGERVVVLNQSALSVEERLTVTLNDVTPYRQHETDLRDWVDRIEAINKITTAVNSSLDFEELFATVCKHVRDIIHYDLACLVLKSDLDSRGCLRAAMCGGGRTSLADIDPSRFADFLERHRNTIISSWQGEDSDLIRSLLGEKVKSFRILPLILNGEPEGCFCVGSFYPDAFSSYHTAVLRGIAAQLATAVHKSRMYLEMQKHLSNLNHLARTSTAMTATLEINGILAQVVEAVEDILAPKIVWVESLKRGELVPLAVAGEAVEEKPVQPVQANAAMQRYLRSEARIYIDQLTEDDTLPEARKQALLALGVQRLLGLPIGRQGPGAMLLWIGRDEGHPFTKSEDELLLTLVSHASAAVANAHLVNEIRETKNYLQNVIESSIDAIVTVDRAGRITFVGKGGQETFGYKEEEIVGQPAWKLYVGGKKVAERLRRELMKKNGKLIDHHIEVFRSDGTKVPVSLSVSRIRSHKGRTVGYLGIAKDMTEQRRAEEEIRRKSEELENFVYLISHNLKAPIVSVQGFASLLMSEGEELEPDQRQRYLDRILKNLTHMQQMIHDLLEFSRIGRIERKREVVDLQQLVESLVDEMRLQLMEKRIAVEVPHDLPRLSCDRDGLAAVFSNLLSNAVKYIGTTEEPKIEIGWEDKGRFYVFWVRDNGIGIEPKYQEKVFELFHRGGADRRVEGTGVGLAIVKRIVENHGGVVRIAAEPGDGTTVYFSIPKKPRGQAPNPDSGR